jgi:hypothetical protein
MLSMYLLLHYSLLCARTCCAAAQATCIIQTLDDAEALLFLDKNFGELFNRMPADEVAVVCKRELSRLSQVRTLCCLAGALQGVWFGPIAACWLGAWQDSTKMHQSCQCLCVTKCISGVACIRLRAAGWPF